MHSDFLEESEDMEAEHKAEVIEEEEESIDYEGGIFVDPLTGEVRKKVITEPREYETEAEEKSETKIDSMAEPATGPDTEHKITSSPGSEDFWYEELDALYRSEEEAAELALKKVEEESNVEAMFVDKVEEPVLITAQFDFEAWQKIEETRIIEESMGEFLVDVIKMAIESSEQREKDLVKMRNTLNKDIGQITHMRKKRSILVQQTAMQREALKEFCEKRDLVRVKLDSLTHKRMRLRQQIRNATLQSGLLSKPLLITDHEDAKKRVEALNETIENLRNKYELLEWRVQQLNKR
ncbi:hypothetical protein GQX74_010569 [Glossina fuscipes]|nr:hypothetical protein GQX74_010569 [Glossina fuscipes]